MLQQARFTVGLSQLTNADVARVGGKNASLGEMLQRLAAEGVRVPDGFATTSDGYRSFVRENGLEQTLRAHIEAFHQGKASLAETGHALRQAFKQGRFPVELEQSIRHSYRQMAADSGIESPEVAVRSSATAEDLPEASFAGQQETYLNIRGEEALLEACRRCFASLFTDRAITYRDNNGIDHLQVALSVGVQRMVRSDQAGAGVMFSIDTETGFPEVVTINANWGLGETVVQGSVDPDEYAVYKPPLLRGGCRPIINRKAGGKERKLIYAESIEAPTELVPCSDEERRRFVLTEDEILALARWALIIERHYARPMDIEWAKDGVTGELFIVQARPETVQSRKETGRFQNYHLRSAGKPLVQGLAIGNAIATGKVFRLDGPDEIERFEEGGVLVTGMTDPDWVPLMKRAAAIVTDHGGRTSHAAIVSRELGLPAIVGATAATERLPEGQTVTVSCAEGDLGTVYEGIAEFDVESIDVESVPETRTAVMVNLANPSAAASWWRLPAAGVGLARMEFIISNLIKIHPLALLHPERVSEADRTRIDEATASWPSGAAYFVDNLAYGIARIAAVFHPKPVIVRLSDFKTNEYAALIGGAPFEPREENPMLGWRGASRYYSAPYREGFALECQALKKVRETIGLDNVLAMVPFCRTPREAEQVIAVMAENGLRRGENGLQLYVMCEVPSNVVLAERFAEHFDGFSIGSNDLTQLVLGVDRDSERLAHLFDEQDEAVTTLIADVIGRARRSGRKIGLCGQAPSDHPEFAAFLVQAGIDSISVDPSAFIGVKARVAEAERMET